MKEYQRYHRVLAAQSYAINKGNKAAALKAFRISCAAMDLQLPEDDRHFVSYWGSQYEKQGHVEGNATSCGRKPKLSAKDAEFLVADLMNWASFGLEGPFKSLTQLKKKSPRAKAILEAADACVSTVISALKKIEPELAYKKLTVKQRLSRKQKEARLRVALKHIKEHPTLLNRVVWVDAKTMYMTIKTRCGWVRLDDEVPFETSRPASKKKPITLRYYIGVCGRAGAVFLIFYTGTTGMKANRDPHHIYLVSSPHVQLRLLLGCCCCNGLPDCFAPAGATASESPREQPHHLKTLPLRCCR